MRWWIGVCAFGVTASIGACASDIAEAPADVSGVTLELTPIDESVVEYRLTNGSDTAVRLARWRTALAQAPERLFEVTRDGEEVRYIGPIVTRLRSSADSYVVLEPGESISADVDIGDYYDLSAGGEFEIRSALRAADVVEAGAPAEMDFESAVARIRVTPSAADEDSAVGSHRAALQISECSHDQAQFLAYATLGAQYALANAFSNYNESRARHYFGDGYYAAGVNSVLHGMWSALADPNLTYRCTPNVGYCEDANLGAYVTPEDLNNGLRVIYFCARIFEPGTLPGESVISVSPAGVVVHELAHLGGALYFPEQYGYFAVRAMATDPNTVGSTWQNADSYRNFLLNSGGF